MRIGIVGCGFFAPNHIHAWNMIDGVAIGGVCDLDPGRAAAAAQLAGAPAFRSLDAMAEAVRPDLVDIVTGPDTHRAVVDTCARLRLPAIVQKPMATSFTDAAAMVARMKASGLAFMVHENFRFQRPIAAVGETIGAGTIGEPVYARIAFRTGHDIFSGQPYLAEAKRFVLMDMGVHVLDVARFLMGEAVTIHCRTHKVRAGIAGEDMANMMLEHASGATSLVECSWGSFVADDPFPETVITVEGTKGAVELRRNYELVTRSDGKVTRTSVEPGLLPWAEKPWHVVQHSVLEAQRHFARAFAEGRAAATSGADNLETLRLVEAAYLSAAEGRIVRPFEITA